MSALKGSSWCVAATMGSGATLAIGLLGVDVREEVGDVTRVASLLGGFATSSFKLFSSFTLVDDPSCDFSPSADVGDCTRVLLSL